MASTNVVLNVICVGNYLVVGEGTQLERKTGPNERMKQSASLVAVSFSTTLF